MSENRPTDPQPVPEDFFRRLCRDAAVALIATDADFRIAFCNAGAAGLLGRSAEQMTGLAIDELVPEKRRSLFRRILRRTTVRRRTQRFRFRLPTADGRRRELLIMLSPIGEADEQCRGVAAWLVDETRQRKLTERLSQAEKLASLGTLAGGVAHHFNNILGGVATFVDFALASGEPAAMRRALRITAEAATRVSKLTRSLLSFAREDKHQSNLADLTETVLTFAHLAERPLKERHVELTLNLEPVPVVEIESARMHQVLANLLTNAEEAMPKGGSIRLAVRRDRDDAVVTFADTGTGIDPEYLPQVFEPFFTTKGALAGGQKANPGLGLAVVHGLVVEMGGSIEVESQPGKGTTFTLRFPIPRRSTDSPAEGQMEKR